MTDEFLPVQFRWTALAASWVVAIYGIYLLVQVIRRIRVSERDVGSGWWLGGALCIGTGIWAQTFLGLAAVHWPIKVGYVPEVVLASWLPAVVISAAVIWMFCQPGLKWLQRVTGGGVFGLGLGLLVVVDVAAMVLRPHVAWDTARVITGLSLILAGCAAGSILIRRELLRNEVSEVRTLLLAVSVGTLLRLGQSALVAAVTLAPGTVCLSVDQLSGDALGWILSATVLMLFVLVHMGTLLDARSRSRQEQLVQSLKKAQTDLVAASFRDAHTGLLNRLGFEEQLKRVLNQTAPAPERATVLRISLDGFRAFVDTYGHTLGDNSIRHLSARLLGLVRDHDVLARSDNDEFLLLCVGLGDPHVASQLAQRLSEALREPCMIDEVDISLTCSIGIAQYPESTNAAQLLAHSMDAMQTARNAGGAVYCFFERGMDRRGAEQVDMQRDLRHAIERGELMLHFQPKLRPSGELAGVEALLRWTHPQRGSVSPAAFIPVAERFGLIGELGLWVLEEACRHVRGWMDAGQDIPVAVNISAHQLRQPDLPQRVRDALVRNNVPPRMLILEITESTAMDDIDASIRVFDMLADIGVQLSIDDFGTGYSSLSYLRRLPAKQLKIDRAFVRDLDSSPDAQAIVEAVVRLSHALGLKVVAEGVETQPQADILIRFACDELQGFLYAKPMPDSALQGWLAQRASLPTVAANAEDISSPSVVA
ncbi:MAG: EAL domain-containing protein [Burkholderiales bacterium]|nr:EAL domain-containing protein [Burkholderiales bacterium]MDE2433680.1 EAL domain-containing protein [Burkholderiales bacterium]